ncbi:hypothetical protein F4804DRAFT_344876 [Jackrogersella minutella]|nr:hypothetical protein F4804DRAFT_344876 [Jackrogersella minutella]
MSSNTELQLSFGLEMEFYIFWCKKNKGPASRPAGFESHPGGPLVIPDEDIDFDGITGPLQEAIRNLLKGAPIVTVTPPDGWASIGQKYDEDWEHLRQYTNWAVKIDISLLALPTDLAEMNRGDYGWCGVEVISPALWATNGAFNQVREVCEFLQRTFWTSTAPQAGLHVHVGNGNLWFSLTQLRQIAAFIYAADPILAQIHPEYRLTNSTYCPSLRLYSNVSLGLKNIPSTTAGVDSITAAPSPSTYVQWARGLLRNISRAFWPEKNAGSRAEEHYPPRPKPVPISDAVAEILQAPDREALADLMEVYRKRAAYSFNQLAWEVKRTIEFRQAASTVDPAEVVSQVRIAVRACEFAATADFEKFQKIIFDCSTAEDDPGWFDVYDLFLELNLRPEAKIVQAALDGTMSDSIRQEYWSNFSNKEKNG